LVLLALVLTGCGSSGGASPGEASPAASTTIVREDLGSTYLAPLAASEPFRQLVEVLDWFASETRQARGA
jgi:hypothetical protein